MRYHEIISVPKISVPEVKLAKITVPKLPAELERDAEKREKGLSMIDRARARTAKAAQAYNDERQAADDEQRRAQKLVSQL